MIIDIFSDSVCPWCRIGKANLMEALAIWKTEEPVTIRWRAFQLDPETPKEGVDFQENMRSKFGEEQLNQIVGHVCKAGEACGITFNFDEIRKNPNTLLSHQLLKLVPPQLQTDTAEALFQAHFQDGRDIGDIDVLAAIAGELGLDADEYGLRLARGEGAGEVEEDLEFARRAGIRAVPYFVFDNKYGLSGAHPVQSFLQAFARLQDEKQGQAPNAQ